MTLTADDCRHNLEDNIRRHGGEARQVMLRQVGQLVRATAQETRAIAAVVVDDEGHRELALKVKGK